LAKISSWADLGYGQAQAQTDGFNDSNTFIDTIRRQVAKAVITSRRHRLKAPQLGRHIYKTRNLVERFFQRLKQFHRIATQYQRLARSYQSIAQPYIRSHMVGLIENIHSSACLYPEQQAKWPIAISYYPRYNCNNFAN